MFNEALRVGSFPLQARNATDLVDTVHGAVLTAETYLYVNTAGLPRLEIDDWQSPEKIMSVNSVQPII
jgi:hypothetical protein